METHRNSLMSDAYASIYENRQAAYTAGESDAKKSMKSEPAKVTGGKTYTMKGKDGKPLFGKEEAEVTGEEQINELAPAVAALAGKAAGSLAGKAAAGGAAKMGGGIAKAASSKLGQKAIGAGSNAIGNKVTSSLTSEETEQIDESPLSGMPSPEEVARRKKQQEFEKKLSDQKDRIVSAQAKADKDKADTNYESYTAAYMEAYKQMNQAKMQDKAAMKPDTPKGEMQARKIDKVRAVAKYAGAEQEEGAKLQNKLNKVNPLKRAFKKPSFNKEKNKAYGLEQKRRADLDKRYGPKNEEIETLEEKEGKKDACYNKVKSRYDVWPSAYASGALVKCRQKGAKNWGNSSKKEEVEAVFATLIGEGIAHNEESAIHILNHMSDEWYDDMVESFLD